MEITTRSEVLEVLRMDRSRFESEILPAAGAALDAQKGGQLRVTSMLGYSNICKNKCLYCGMRAGNTGVKRYRIAPAEIVAAAKMAAESGFGRIFLISGEDPGAHFEDLLHMVEQIHALGLYQSLACGEYSAQQYAQLRAAGADEYVMKFEMSDPETFDRLNPSTNFAQRMAAIEAVQASGMKLASGNIVGFPGQDIEQLADDIMLMKELQISWAPVIPYMPAMGTPLAAEGGRGDLLTNLKEIALLRLMIPGVNITAQQPGEDLKNGLADEQGNLDAIAAGANVLFCDLLPETMAGDFRVIDHRNVTGTAHLYQIAEKSGLELDFGV